MKALTGMMNTRQSEDVAASHATAARINGGLFTLGLVFGAALSAGITTNLWRFEIALSGQARTSAEQRLKREVEQTNRLMLELGTCSDQLYAVERRRTR